MNETPIAMWPRGAGAHGPRTKKKMRAKQRRDKELRDEEQLGMFREFETAEQRAARLRKGSC